MMYSLQCPISRSLCAAGHPRIFLTVKTRRCDEGESGCLRQLLPVTSSRSVPGACSISLCAYHIREQLTWSPMAARGGGCTHALHTNRIVAWLAKEEPHSCPVCRQTFWETKIALPTPVATPTDTQSNRSPTHQFSQQQPHQTFP
jgi:Anaphase-promoting complex subunit 11 RING-H2 finger